jgi:hypothetical protein
MAASVTAGNYNDPMVAVRYLALAALAVWLGGMIALPLLVAPAVPRMALGDVLHRFHLLAYSCGITVFVSLFVMKFLGPPPRAFPVRAAIVFVMLLLAVYSGLRMAHEVSTPLTTVNVGLGLLLLFWYVRE